MSSIDFNPNMPEPIERVCPVCGSEEYCMAFDELGYCPADWSGSPHSKDETPMTDKRPMIYVSDRQAEIDRVRREAEQAERIANFKAGIRRDQEQTRRSMERK